MQADPAVQNLALHIFLSAVEQGLRTACPVAQANTARIGPVAFMRIIAFINEGPVTREILGQATFPGEILV